MTDSKVKKRKVSKKTKKSWRKYVDIKDVDEFLENQRFEERLGAPFSERSDVELFTFDNTKETDSIINVTKAERRLTLKNKEPTCFNVLKPHTLVPDPISKRNRVRTREERRHPIAKRIDAERKAKGILKLKEKLALRNRALANAKRATRHKRGEFDGDIWETTDASIPNVDPEWLSPATARHTLIHLGKKKKLLPSLLHKKPSVLPTIEAPHPGTSYNPSYADHQELLHEVAQQELELMKQEAHLDRVTTKMFRKISNAEKAEDLITEMSEGLPLKQTSEASALNVNNTESVSEEDNDTTVTSINPPVKNVKKTKVQRRKQKEQKELAQQLVQKKVEKKKVSDIYKLKLLQKHLDTKEKKKQTLKEKREKLKTIKSTQAKRLSKIKFEPLEPEFKLANELSGNLRNAAPSGTLLKDRYKSLQQRNIVAPATLVLKRSKAKVKRFLKPDHKISINMDL